MTRPACQDGDRAHSRSSTVEGEVLHSDGGAGVVYWLLISLSVLTLAPCLILPAWRDYQDAERLRRATLMERSHGAATIENLQRQQEALAVDPGVVSRLARRQLAYREPGEEIVLHAPIDLLERLQQERVALPRVLPEVAHVDPVAPPVAVARLMRLLPDFNYDALFCDAPNRGMLMALSGGLFVAAIVIFWPAARYDTRRLRPTHAGGPSTE